MRLSNAGLATNARALVKAVGTLLLIVSGILTAATGYLWVRDEKSRRSLSIRLTSLFSRWILRWLTIRVQCEPPLCSSWKSRLIVSNHLSDVDMMVLSSLEPSIFITSIEVRETPFLGRIAAWAGSVFVERRQPLGVAPEITAVANLLRQGFSVTLFAEATSSNGDGVRPFKRAFFQSAIDARAVIQPVCLQYKSIDGQPVDKSNRDHVFYYGDMGFAAHLFNLCRTRSIEVTCRWLDPIVLTGTEDRKEVANECYRAVTNVFQPASGVSFAFPSTSREILVR